MKSVIAAIVLTLTASFALAADEAKKPSEKQLAQQQKMKSCNDEAGSKALKGDARKAFMKECLSGAAPAAATAPAKPSEVCQKQVEEKKLAGAAKTSFLKKCEADAAAPAAAPAGKADKK